MTTGASRADLIISETLDRASIILHEKLLPYISETEIRDALCKVEDEMHCPKRLRNNRECGIILCPHHGNTPRELHNYVINPEHRCRFNFTSIILPNREIYNPEPIIYNNGINNG